MPCQTIGPGREQQGVDVKLPSQPPFETTSWLIEVPRPEWHRATARKLPKPTCEACAVGPGDTDGLIDGMAVW